MQLPNRCRIGRLVGTDADGSGVAIANIKLLKDLDGDGDIEDDEETVEAAELAIRDVAAATQSPLAAETLSPAVISEETSGRHSAPR